MKRKNLIIVIVAVVILAVLLVAFKAGSGSSANLTQYKLAKVDYGQVQKTVSATGTLQPWTSVDIKSKAGGQVMKLPVDVGTVVKKGDVIAKIDPTDSQEVFDADQANIDGAVAHTDEALHTWKLQEDQTTIGIANAQAALQNAKAAQANAQQRLEEAQTESKAQPALTTANIGQAEANLNATIEARDAMKSTDPQSLASAQSAYNQAVANENAAKLTVQRQITLAADGFVPQQTVDTDQAAYEVSEAQVASAKKIVDTIGAQIVANDQNADAKVAQAKAALVSAQSAIDVQEKQNAVLQAQSSLTEAKAQVVEAQQALNTAYSNTFNNTIKQEDVTANNATVKADQASFQDAKVTLDQTTVTAPSDGIILDKDVEQGTIITSGDSLSSTGTTIVTMGDISQMYVQATVDETDIAGVSKGQDVEVDFDAYPGIPFDGTVFLIDPQAAVNQNVTQFDVRVEVDNSSPTFRLLMPGMNATCNFIVSKKDNVLMVPNEALQTDDSGSYVQVASGGRPAPADPASGLPADPEMRVDVKLSHRTVETGLEGDDSTEITSGLKRGDMVVTESIAPMPTSNAPSSPFGGGGGRPGGFGGGGGRGR